MKYVIIYHSHFIVGFSGKQERVPMTYILLNIDGEGVGEDDIKPG